MKHVNYLGADFLIIKKDDAGIHLGSPNKNLTHIVVVPHKQGFHVKTGYYDEGRRRSYYGG